MTELIYSKVAAVMADCGHVAKRDRNSHDGYVFRGIDAVVNAVGPILRKHQVIVIPTVESVTYESVQTSTGKPACACRVLVTYTFHAEDGSSLPVKVAGEAWDRGDKAAPKAMSVAFRTALLQALALPTDEADPDSHTYEQADAVPQETPRQTAERGITQAPDAATLDRVVEWMATQGLDADEELSTQVKARREALAVPA